MTVYRSEGFLDTVQVILSGTSPTPIFTASDVGNNGLIIDSVRLVNTTGGSLNVALDRHDGTTAFVLYPSTALAAAGVVQLETPWLLRRAWNLRVTGAAGIHVTVSFLRPFGS